MQLITALQAAIANPTQANVKALLHVFDVEIAQQSEQDQFHTAGEVIMQLAQLIELRAMVWLADWDERHQPPSLEDPIVTTDMLQDVLRQTMTLNLEDILEPFERKEREASDSIVGVVEKANLMQLLDEIEATEAKQAALAIAYEEDISQWAKQICQRIHNRTPISLADLFHQLPMPFAQVWLALLLGEFRLEQTGAFYDASTILVSLPYRSMTAEGSP
jgi:hypothetical protein